jgi:hypothetical protein
MGCGSADRNALGSGRACPALQYRCGISAGQAPPLHLAGWLKRHHERPPLLRFPVPYRILLHIPNGPANVIIRVEEYGPALSRPGRRNCPVRLTVVGQRMKALGGEPLCRPCLQVAYHLLCAMRVPGDHQMGMSRQYGARTYHVPRFSDGTLESDAYRPCLPACERNRRIAQGTLGLLPVAMVVRLSCHRTTRGDLGGLAILQQFPLPDPIRPRSARSIGQPEAVGGHNGMVRTNHATDSTAPSGAHKQPHAACSGGACPAFLCAPHWGPCCERPGIC